MQRQQKLLLSFMVGGLMLFYGTTAVAALPPQEIAKTALGSTVHLGFMDAKGNSWTGSGFVVHDDQIATNHHVIENMSIGGARLVGKEEVYPIEAILAVDKERDLAVIKVAGLDVSALPLGDSDTVQIGDKVYVAGNPRRLEGTFTGGMISAIRPEGIPLVRGKTLQMDAAISPGSSGGPVLNDRGEVIGISVGHRIDGQNLNFAIPVNYLRSMVTMPISPAPVQPKQVKPKVNSPPVELKPTEPQAHPPPVQPKQVKPRVNPSPVEPKQAKPKVDPPPVESKPTQPQVDPSSVEPKPVLTSQDIAKIALDSTVHLATMNAKDGNTGSGFFVGPNQIVTNYHVIEAILNEGAIGGAKLVGKEDIYAIEDIVDFDKKNDLAIVKVRRVKGTGIDAPALRLGDSDTVQIGERVYVAGNPQGLEGTFSDGIISAIRPGGLPPLVRGKILQMTAPVSPGSSGGPVLNDGGEVIGISVLGSIREDAQNLNFAIPVNYLKSMVTMPIPPTPVKPKQVKPKVSPSPVEPKPAKPQVNPPPVEPKSVKPKVDPSPVEPKQVKPPVDPPKPKPPKPRPRPPMLDKGIKLYEQARYNEAIEVLNPVIQEIENPIHQAEAYLYLGGSKRGSGASNDTVKEEFQKAIRHNPNQELPPRVGEDHPIFAELIEEVRKELTGELTVISLLPQTEIWIYDTRTEKKKLGTGRVRSRLLRGNYIVEGIYAGESQRKTVTIELDRHEVLYLDPNVEHDSPSSISVGEKIPLTLNLISSEGPQQVKIYYKIYDRDDNELEQHNQEMGLWDQQPALSTWIYKVDLPSQKRVGLIEYHIALEYDNHLAFRYPGAQSRYYQISIVDNKPPTISVLDPPEGARFTVNQQTIVRAEVIDNSIVKDVRIYFSSGDSQKLFEEGSSGMYAIDITLSRVGSVEYYLTATDEVENRSRSESRHLDIRLEAPPVPPDDNNVENDQSDEPTESGISEESSQSPILEDKPPTINLLYPPEGARFTVNQQITIRAKVTDDTAVKEVLVHFSSGNSRKLFEEGSSGIYAMDISFSRAGSVEYYLTATDEAGNKSQSESRQIKMEESVVDPPPPPPPTYPIYQGIWAGISVDRSSISAWNEDSMLRLAYLHEGKNQSTLGAQLEFFPSNNTNISVMIQWGPAIENSNVAFTFLGGIAKYQGFSNAWTRATYMTPILGAGLKFYPQDKIVIDATCSIKFRSDFDTTYLYHYEVGARFYITHGLSLRAGYGKLYLGDEDITTLQIGLGVNF